MSYIYIYPKEQIVFLLMCISLPLLQHRVVTVAGDHHVHLNSPEVVAPLVSEFLQSNVLIQQLPA